MTTNTRLLAFSLLLGLSSYAHSMGLIFKQPQQPLFYRLGTQAGKAIKNTARDVALTVGSSLLAGSAPILAEFGYRKYNEDPDTKYCNAIDVKTRAREGAKAVLYALGATGVAYAPQIATYLTKNLKNSNVKSSLSFMAQILSVVTRAVFEQRIGVPASSSIMGIRSWDIHYAVKKKNDYKRILGLSAFHGLTLLCGLGPKI
jgi:hypothetical protein